MDEMVEHWTRKQVFQKVKQLIHKKTIMRVDKISEKGISQEASIQVKMMQEPKDQLAQTSNVADQGSNAEHGQELESDNDEPNQFVEPVLIQDDEEEDKQSAMLQVADNLHAQLTRLNVAPSVKDWNSIARFLQKSNILDRVEKASEVSNQRAQTN